VADEQTSRIQRWLEQHDAAAHALGIRIEETGKGRAVCTLTLEPRHANPFGMAHGGVIFTLADTAFGYASNAAGTRTVAAGADIDYLRPGRIGDTLTAVAEHRASAGRTGLYELTIAGADGETVARMTGRARQIGGSIGE